MDLGIKGRTAIVCGSSRGIGEACAIALAEAGVAVVINGRNKDTLEKAVRNIEARTGVVATAVPADITTETGREALLNACPEPDILINNAGAPPYRDFRELDEDAIIDGLRLNMIAPIALSRAVLDSMTAKRFGRIVTITSVTVKMPLYGLDLSSGARAGFTAFMAGIARSVVIEHNVTINHLLPGYVDTARMRENIDLAAAKTGDSPEAIAVQREQLIPARRFAEPAELGQTCAFLCSTHAGYLTGQNVLLDGGLFNSTF